MGLRAQIVRQFRRPEGPLGRLAGRVMAARPSNRRRNLWTVDLLKINPGDRVLEVGCGPGLALAACVERARCGLVVGLDHSPVMVEQAARRNRFAVESGRLRLHLGGLEAVDALGGPFDRVLLINVIQFLPERGAAIRALHDVLAPGGTLAVTYQPRHRNPTRADALAMADEVRRHMAAAGLEDVRMEELELRPVPAVCVLGRRAAAGAEERSHGGACLFEGDGGK